ncbi:arsenate reductase ArsC [Chitinilyticum litopenaei]|uniref:arsenate reductase ArsC n=1 Tax=Chitinilyticum litopenaei TaxID=1121276 RepID=UPI000418D8EB|nr:arsenate reductase ArsC [Chitinilyticum litopenaei]
MSKKFNVLFLCTANSARSIMSEGLLNHLGGERFQAYSAGSQPGTQPNPLAIELLQKLGHDTSYMYSKSWDVFEGEDAPKMDIIITVCGNAAKETCPYWPGHPVTAHWGYDDPHGETEEEKRQSFAKIFLQIKHRIELLISLPDEKIAHLAHIREIGEPGVLDGVKAE